MSIALILACFWVLAVTGVAVLPEARQSRPALVLFCMAVPLLVWIYSLHGFGLALACSAAVMSLYRDALRALWARFSGASA